MAITSLLYDEKKKYFFTSKYGIIHSTPLSSDLSRGFNMYNFTSPAASPRVGSSSTAGPPCRDKSVCYLLLLSAAKLSLFLCCAMCANGIIVSKPREILCGSKSKRLLRPRCEMLLSAINR